MYNEVPTFSLYMKEEDLEELRSDIYNDLPLPADLVIDHVTYDVDIAYRGSYTRNFRKRSYFIEFIEPDIYAGGREIHLNAEYRDPSSFRNKLSLDFFHDLGVLSPKSYHVNLVRNGDLKGVYLVLESVDDLFLKNRGLPSGPIYYAVNNNANFSFRREGRKKRSRLSGYRRKYGNEKDDDFIRELLNVINKTSRHEFSRKIVEHLHLDKYLNWLAGAVLTMNNDGFTHNYALYRNSETELFEIIPWDYDATWGRRVDGGKMAFDYVSIQGKEENYLTQRIFDIPEFRKRYKEKLEDILETKFTLDYMEGKIESLHNSLRPHILNDPYKKRKMDEYDQEPEYIYQFIKDRTKYIKDQLVQFI